MAAIKGHLVWGGLEWRSWLNSAQCSESGASSLSFLNMLFCLCTCICLYECICAHVCAAAHGDEKGVLDPLEMESQGLVSHHGAGIHTLALCKSSEHSAVASVAIFRAASLLSLTWDSSF